MKQNRMICITGGVAAGKSTVTNKLHQLGYFVVDSDHIAHEILKRGEVVKKIEEVFGLEVVVNGKIHHKLLAEKVFSNRASLEKLEKIIYPSILEEIRTESMRLLEKESVVFVDIPLYYEKKPLLKMDFDEIWLVYTNKEQQVERMIHDRGMTLEEATLRLNAQIPMHEKRKWAEVILDNTKDLVFLHQQIERELERLGEKK